MAGHRHESVNTVAMRVGIALPQYVIDVEPGIEVWPAMLSIARRADALGLDSVWLSDHPFVEVPHAAPSGALEPFVAAASLLRATERVHVGTLVASASMRAPGLIGHQFASVDAAGSGRAIAGMGAGWYEPEHRAFGVPLRSFAARAVALEETLDALEAGGGPAVSVLVGGTGRRMLDLAARRADLWNVAWDVGPETFAGLNSRLDDACAAAGRDPATLRRTVGLNVAVGRTDRAIDAAIERLQARAAFLSSIDRPALQRHIVIGTPDRCAAALAAYARCDQVIVALLMRDDVEMLELFASEVVPLLRS